MSKPVTTRIEDGIAVVVIENPPVNALGLEVRQGIVEAIGWAEAEGEARGVLIAARGRVFTAGADIKEFGKPPVEPILPSVCNRIEACAKPVAAAVQGAVLGGGCELAMAAHYRIAGPDARMGLPEVTLGLLPGAGGTVRAPRLMGPRAALDLMLSGKPVDVREAESAGLVDRVVEGDLETEALDWFRRLLSEGAGPRPTRGISTRPADGADGIASLESARAGLGGSPQLAPARIVDCVEAALTKPFDAALEFERAAFLDCLASDQSRALRHVFFAERRAAKFPGIEGTAPRDAATVGVIGGGTMGAGISAACLLAKLKVVLVERDAAARDAALARVTALLDRAAAKGKLDADGRAECLAALTPGLEIGEAAEADVIVEAVVEDMEIKAELFAELGRIARSGAVLATNTSYLDVNRLARESGRPEDVLGLHFFSPAHVMRLVEVAPADSTSPETVAAAFALAKRLGKLPVRAGATEGFIGNRMLSAYRMAADICLEEGASPAGADAAMREYGFPLGPYQVSDMAGLDIAWARRKRLAETRDPSERYLAAADRLCELGRFGQKSGRGWYIYAHGGREGAEDPEVLEILSEERRAKGLAERAVGSDEIRRRCLSALANEGARLVAVGTALRPSDIDVVMIHGYGFPRWRGGPMMAADIAGLAETKRDLSEFAPDAPNLWTPEPLLDELLDSGRGFSDLNC